MSRGAGGNSAGSKAGKRRVRRSNGATDRGDGHGNRVVKAGDPDPVSRFI